MLVFFVVEIRVLDEGKIVDLVWIGLRWIDLLHGRSFAF
jgi:hypothetical protein